jgi:hypothetical protein
METAQLGMAIAMIAFGCFVWSAGIVIFFKLWIETTWWDKLVSNLLAVPLADLAPSNVSGLAPMFQEMIQHVEKRIVWVARQATIVISVGLFLIGAAINMVGIYMLYW